jgi:hypothetical protein
MGTVLTEGTNLAVVAEATAGAATPPSTGWRNMEPNSYGDFGAMFKKLARTPISKNRQNLRPILIDMSSGLPYESDITKDLVDTYLDGMMMAAVKHCGGTGVSFFYPSAVTATGFTVAAAGNIANDYLVYSRNWRTTANNGLKKLAGTSTTTEVKTAGLVAETLPADGAPPTLDVVGFEGATGTLGLDGSGDLVSTAGVDFTTMGLTVGQWIYFPSQAEATAMGSANYAFNLAAYTGYAKIKAISATKLTLERRSWTVGAATTDTGKTIRFFFSRFCRNVALDHADYLSRSYAFEVTYPDLEAGPADAYEYLLGNYLDEFVWNMPVASKATAQLAFVGTETLALTTSRATGPSTAKNASTALAVGTSTDLPRLSIADVDETGVATDFQSMKVTLKNVSPENKLGKLGAGYMAIGRFELMMEADVIFTSKEVIDAVRDNRIVRLDCAMRNGDFGIFLDVPSVSLDETPKKMETNKLVKITAKLSGFMDASYGCTAGVSVFGYLPTA